MTITSFLPLAVILVPLLAAIPIALTGKKQNVREFWTFLAAGINIVLLLIIAQTILDGNSIKLTFLTLIPNVDFGLKVDAFGLLFALVAGILWLPTSIYSMGYMRPLKEHAQTRYFCFFAIAISATMGVAFSSNLLTLYLFYEALSLSTYPLVTHHQDAEARTGGRKYLTYLLGTSIGFALPALIMTYQLTGTLDFSALGVFVETSVPLKTLTILLLLFLFGFSKAGMMPFHSWLPGAMVAPTPVSSLLHAVAVVKVGVFCVLRVLTGIFGLPLLSGTSLSTVVCVIAGFTVIVSSLIALSQDNLKRRLAFSTVGQLSYIVLGAGVASKMAVAGSMLHIAMHAAGKITLFFCAGAIFVATGKKYISQMVGIGRQMPFTMAAFFIGSLSVIGLPPTGGLLSKWLMVTGTLTGDKVWVLGIYLVSSLLNAAYFLPIVYNAFFCSDKDSQYKDEVKEAPLNAVLPPLITAAFCIILFFYPEPFFTLARLAIGGS